MLGHNGKYRVYFHSVRQGVTKCMVRAVNDAATLYEVADRDIWQCEVVTCDGVAIGRAVKQIVEPRACAVRYLVIYEACSGRRFLLPATFVVDAEPGRIICSLTAVVANRLPAYQGWLLKEQSDGWEE